MTKIFQATTYCTVQPLIEALAPQKLYSELVCRHLPHPVIRSSGQLLFSTQEPTPVACCVVKMLTIVVFCFLFFLKKSSHKKKNFIFMSQLYFFAVLIR